MPRHPIVSEPVRLGIPHQGHHRVRAASIIRIDDTHANPKTAWEALGSPAYLSQKNLELLMQASELVELAKDFSADGSQTWIDLVLPPQSLALILLEWA